MRQRLLFVAFVGVVLASLLLVQSGCGQGPVAASSEGGWDDSSGGTGGGAFEDDDGDDDFVQDEYQDEDWVDFDDGGDYVDDGDDYYDDGF